MMSDSAGLLSKSMGEPATVSLPYLVLTKSLNFPFLGGWRIESKLYRERQRSIILGSAQSITGYFGVSRPILLGHWAFQAVLTLGQLQEGVTKEEPYISLIYLVCNFRLSPYRPYIALL